ncbi:MAG TPA: helix-turn-helix domain-containing protein [Aeromicrobium sp.]|nr:helix-turn-helix domain-containing protein [Aeromicrobium sp.]HKY57523.1 helix-turn-helix domain-containing protein [Aeromicrobium sp.]
MDSAEPGWPAHAIEQLLAAGALDPVATRRFHEVMRREGVGEAELAQPGAQVPLRWFREAYPDLDSDQATHLGFITGEYAGLTSYGVLSVPLVSAGSVSEILRLLDFLPLISNAIHARSLESEDGVVITLTTHSGDPVLDRFAAGYTGAALLRLIRLLADDAPGLEFHFAWPMPPQMADHPDVLAGRLRFDAPMNYVYAPTSTLEAVCRYSDPMAYAHAIDGLKRALESRSIPYDVTEQVRRILDQGPGLMHTKQVAAKLNLSVSTLKRRLAMAGTSFSDLLEASLQDRAMLRLLDPTCGLEEIATDLGYSDLANFSHAFKRWTGTTPGRFRREHQRVG